MNKALSTCILVGALFVDLATARAQTIIYQEDWGTTNGGSAIAYGYSGNQAYPFGQVGWSIIVPSAQTGSGPPYEGIYVANSASDANTGYSLPANTVYYTTMTAGQAGFIYTTAGASGSSGDSVFPSGGINPASYPGGLYLNAEVTTEGSSAVNYFAVQLNGTSWYVSATPMSASAPTYPQFVNVCLEYVTTAGAWNNLTVVSPNTVTIGSAAGALSGTITGIGIVQVGPGGWNYNEIAITTACGGLGVGTPAAISVAPFNQTVYAGGGVSFVVEATGTAPLTYTWTGPNGVIGPDVPGSIEGSDTAEITLFDVQSDDAGTYTVEVSNDDGANTASATGFTLTVNPVPSDYLYAETVPYIGPSGNLPTSTIGWVTASINGGIYSSGGGAGAVFAYTGATDTVIYYADTTTDTNQAGLAFPNINPADYPYIAFETSLDANSVVTDVTACFAVQMTSGSATNWYVHGTPIDENLATTGTFETQELQFTTEGSQWKNLTVTATGATIGSQVSGTLAGNITGAGLVFSFNGGGGDFNWDQFLITTDQVLATPPVIGAGGIPWSQAVYSGGGVSYEVTTESGTQPFTYNWTLNGVTLADGPLADGAVVSGSQTPILTIAGVTTNEVGGNGGTVDVVAFVHNSQGSDESDSDNYYGPGITTMTVNNPAIGTIYDETFPWLNPAITGNYSIALDGWTEAFYQSPASLFNENDAGDGAVFVYNGSAIRVAYYTDTFLDTNQSGLPFPNIDPAGFPGSLTFSVDLEAGGGAGNVTAYWAVAMTSGNVTNWFVSANAITAPGGSFAPATLVFNPTAANWDNLTITPSGAVVGAPAASPLSGVITGAGLVFVITGTGGDYNFDNFAINGTGVGNIVAGPLKGGSTTTLSWVGNPAVQLQSATSLANGGNWANVVPSTLGAYSATVPVTGPQKFYRLVGPVSAE
jgi:hypothetical protein